MVVYGCIAIYTFRITVESNYSDNSFQLLSYICSVQNNDYVYVYLLNIINEMTINDSYVIYKLFLFKVVLLISRLVHKCFRCTNF